MTGQEAGWRGLIRYCGGCNPRYERSEAVRQLCAALPEVTWTYDVDESRDFSVIVCGCESACVKPAAYIAPYGVYILWEEAAACGLAEQLRSRMRI